MNKIGSPIKHDCVTVGNYCSFIKTSVAVWSPGEDTSLSVCQVVVVEVGKLNRCTEIERGLEVNRIKYGCSG